MRMIDCLSVGMTVVQNAYLVPFKSDLKTYEIVSIDRTSGDFYCKDAFGKSGAYTANSVIPIECHPLFWAVGDKLEFFPTNAYKRIGVIATNNIPASLTIETIGSGALKLKELEYSYSFSEFLPHGRLLRKIDATKLIAKDTPVVSVSAPNETPEQTEYRKQYEFFASARPGMCKCDIPLGSGLCRYH